MTENGYTVTFHNTPPILLTEKVYTEYKKACPESSDITKEMWKLQDKNLYPNYTIYGGNIYFVNYK